MSPGGKGVNGRNGRLHLQAAEARTNCGVSGLKLKVVFQWLRRLACAAVVYCVKTMVPREQTAELPI